VFSVADRRAGRFSVTVSVGDVTMARAGSHDGYSIVNPAGAICAPMGGEAKIGIRGEAHPVRVFTEVWILH
jgi:hypothetical protein